MKSTSFAKFSREFIVSTLMILQCQNLHEMWQVERKQVISSRPKGHLTAFKRSSPSLQKVTSWNAAFASG